MSCGRKDEYESPSGIGAASTGTGRGTAQSEAVITDGVLAQQEQQAGGQQSRETLSRQSVHALATGTRGSRQAKATSSTVKRAEGRRSIGMILHKRRPVAEERTLNPQSALVDPQSARGEHNLQGSVPQDSCDPCVEACFRRGGPRDAVRHPVWPPWVGGTVGLRHQTDRTFDAARAESPPCWPRSQDQIPSDKGNGGPSRRPTPVRATGRSPTQGGHMGCLAASHGPPLRENERLVRPPTD